MQFARHTPAFFFLGIKYPLGELLELGIRKAAFAQVDQHARPEDQKKRGDRDRANIEERAMHPRQDVETGGGTAGEHVIDEYTRAHSPLPTWKRRHIGDHACVFTGRRFRPHIGVIPAAIARDADQLVHHGRAVAVSLACKVAVDPVRLARADKGGAVVVVDKELPLFAINHR